MTPRQPTTNPDRNSALLLIDLQNDYCHPDGVFATAGLRLTDLTTLVARVNTLTAAARSQHRPVIWVRMEWPDDTAVGLLAERSPFLRERGLRAGTWGAELVAGLDVSPADHTVVKSRFSAFHHTTLDQLLAELDVTTLVLAGVRTDFCVESTVRDAFFRDLRAVVAEDAVAGYFADLHQHSLRLMGTVFAEVVPTAEAARRLADDGASPPDGSAPTGGTSIGASPPDGTAPTGDREEAVHHATGRSDAR
ncbi:isochorismatase family cysteine hydrolase [Streptomyces sp. DSM 44915]|uniref:Isochorismatase family cysteine hydrolase n=1 Tax=Streptomyces chisholmiae TaxID=3075540 RepID=A0ABU2JXI1_9ACTN|nr:isochorismatase family cysteine hydrolase [Streptomyces sp. DSM 44915]MDT0269675.1 isochorismatase family cysteine hydrolase [Streptomyces sp. DSM 44915]